MRPAEPPVNLVLGHLPQEQSGRFTKLTTHIHLVPRPKVVEIRSTGFCRWYINITITILDILYLPVFYLKSLRHRMRSIDLSVSHRKHITYLLRAQQVDVIYRLVTMVY
jgi:hypothetical protein